MDHTTILVTPKGKHVVADGLQRTIVFPPLRDWQTMPGYIARQSGSERIAGPDYEQVLARLNEGKRVDLAWGGQLRLGCGIGLLVNGRPTLRRASTSHPTRPNCLTPPAGLHEYGSPMLTAINELCEEFIVRCDDRVGLWNVGGISRLSRAMQYARRENLQMNFLADFSVTSLYGPLHWQIKIGYRTYHTLIAFEPDTSSIEMLFTGTVTIPPGWYIVDGEQLSSGAWLNEDIIVTEYHRYPQTTKAQVFLEACSLGFTTSPSKRALPDWFMPIRLKNILSY